MTSIPDFILYGVKLRSRLILGTSQYPSPAILAEAARASGAEILTVSLRRESARLKEGQDFWRLIRDIGARILPNTAGCHSVKEAVTTAQMAREVFGTPWVKLEVIGEADTLQPDPFGLVEAARILSADGFQVFPYTTEDLVVAERLIEAGCKVLMPWGAPIGSGKGLNNVFGLEGVARAFPRGSTDRGCGPRPAVACGRGDGAWLRWRSTQYRCRQGGRSRRDGARFRSSDRGGPRGFPGRAHGIARHGRALDAGRRPGGAHVSPLDSFYPIVDSAAWVGRLVGVGARFIQLRIKDATDDHLRSETHHALTICRRSGAELVVNDHWEIAIDSGADWVHLGQGDLDEADVLAVRKAGIRTRNQHP